MRNFLILLIPILFIACKKDGYDAKVDYNYPFKIEIKQENSAEFQKEFPLSILINNDSKYNNENNNYTLKFETDGDGYVVDSKGKNFSSNQILPFTYNSDAPLKIQYVPITKGRQTINITITNSKNYSVTEKVIFDIPDRILIKSLDYKINVEGDQVKSINTDKRYFQKNSSSSYLTPNIDLEVSSPKVQVKFSDKINSLDYVLYNNVSYKINEWITVDSDKINSIKLFSKNSNYGDEEIILNIKDSYGNETIPSTTKFRYLTFVTWDNKRPFSTYYVVNAEHIYHRPNPDHFNYYYRNIENISAIKFIGNGSKIAKIYVVAKISKAFNSNNWISMNLENSYDVSEVIFNDVNHDGSKLDRYKLKDTDVAHCVYRITIFDEFGFKTVFEGEEFNNSLIRTIVKPGSL